MTTEQRKELHDELLRGAKYWERVADCLGPFQFKRKAFFQGVADGFRRTAPLIWSLHSEQMREMAESMRVTEADSVAG